MGLGFLPWEKWLPPYVFGPLMCVGCGLVLMYTIGLRWWEILLLGFGAVFGALGTLVWFMTRRNIFDSSDPKA